MPQVLDPPPKTAAVRRRRRGRIAGISPPPTGEPLRPIPADLPAAAALLERLFGPMPLHRVVWDPFPGTATLEDCERFLDAGRLCELVDGVLLEKPIGVYRRSLETALPEKTVGWTESAIVTFLAETVGRWDPGWRRGRRTTEAGFVELPSGQVRGPDYSFFRHARFPGGALPPNSKGSVKVPALTPDFAVEILSESNTREEIDGKLDDLFAAGCRLAWVVDPRARTARVVTLAAESSESTADAERPWVETTKDDSATLTGDPVLPGFAVSLAELLAAPDGAGEAATPDGDTGG